MVALSGSLMFTVFVFMLTRDASAFFQAQARTSETTLATLTGFEKLRNDIARAGFLASPNLTRDKNRCPRNVAGATAMPQQAGTDFNTYLGLQQMGLLRILQGQAADYAGNVTLEENAGGITPDKLVLYGNYTTTEQFPIARISPEGTSPTTIVFEDDSLVLARVGITATTPDTTANPILQSIFRAGSLLRLVDTRGREQYGIVQSISMGANGPELILDPGIGLIWKNTSQDLCGIKGACTGCLVNPVDIVRYDVVPTTSPPTHLSPLYQGAGPEYESDRLDLYRYHLLPTLDNAANVTTVPDVYDRAELIAEYVVDLKFGLTVVGNTTTGALLDIDEEDYTNLSKYAGVPFESPADGLVAGGQTAGPHFIRGVWARLNVRNREADRDAPIVSNATSSSALYRVRVKVGNSGQQRRDTFARMRSLRSHIATRNTQNLMWN